MHSYLANLLVIMGCPQTIPIDIVNYALSNMDPVINSQLVTNWGRGVHMERARLPSLGYYKICKQTPV